MDKLFGKFYKNRYQTNKYCGYSEIEDMINEGMSEVEIANELGLSKESIDEIRKKFYEQ